MRCTGCNKEITDMDLLGGNILNPKYSYYWWHTNCIATTNFDFPRPSLFPEEEYSTDAFRKMHNLRPFHKGRDDQTAPGQTQISTQLVQTDPVVREKRTGVVNKEEE